MACAKIKILTQATLLFSGARYALGKVMTSAITYKGFGFWVSNGICESIYDYILNSAKIKHPELVSKLEDDSASYPWRLSGFCPEVEELLKLVDLDVLTDLIKVDQNIMDITADNEEWKKNLTKALRVTESLLHQKLKVKIDDEKSDIFNIEV